MAMSFLREVYDQFHQTWWFSPSYGVNADSVDPNAGSQQLQAGTSAQKMEDIP